MNALADASQTMSAPDDLENGAGRGEGRNTVLISTMIGTRMKKVVVAGYWDGAMTNWIDYWQEAVHIATVLSMSNRQAGDEG
jgi:hypothetical protein